jgi:hypothetical protein
MAHRLADDLAGKHNLDAHQIDPAHGGGNIGNIRHPYLVSRHAGNNKEIRSHSIIFNFLQQRVQA